ncbi:MAG: response regulator [Bdellovibrionia bacterium]
MRTTVPAKSITKRPPPDPRSSVLLIDDCEDVALALKDMLELQGVLVVSRSSGASAIRELQTGRRFGLVLLDFDLQDMTGNEFLEELQHHNLADNQPIVGFASRTDLKTAFPLSDLLRKPVDLADLLVRIRSYLTLH